MTVFWWWFAAAAAVGDGLIGLTEFEFTFGATATGELEAAAAAAAAAEAAAACCESGSAAAAGLMYSPPFMLK